jgi:hypothetical protein
MSHGVCEAHPSSWDGGPAAAQDDREHDMNFQPITVQLTYVSPTVSARRLTAPPLFQLLAEARLRA